jgi:type III secretory pathway component EscT
VIDNTAPNPPHALIVDLPNGDILVHKWLVVGLLIGFAFILYWAIEVFGRKKEGK